MPQDACAHLQWGSPSSRFCFSSSSWLYHPTPPLPTWASPLPVLFYPYLLPSSSYTVVQAALRLPSFTAPPIPPHPSPCPSPAHSTPHALPHGPFRRGEQPPCSIALPPINQIQRVQLLLNAAVCGGETFQYAQMEPLGNLTADTEVITAKHMWTAISHRCTVLLNMSRFQRNN